jgi:phosphoribosyl 1,2-cyclic phosphodiesterase
MIVRFTVLASGSAGNAALVQSDQAAWLIDGGLQPRVLRERLASQQLAPEGIAGMLLTHTHGDHWNDALLGWLLDRGCLLVCHPSHEGRLERSGHFLRMKECGFVRYFQSNLPFDLPGGFQVTPVPVRHDGGATFGFRLRGPADLFGSAVELGYASDLGVWDEALVQAFLGIDLLALEFNHDLELENRSPRPRFLIDRVLGDHGHLSNVQAADFLRQLLQRETTPRLGWLVQLHLSSDCNRPALARQAAQRVLDEAQTTVAIHTAKQEAALKPIVLNRLARQRPPRGGRSRATSMQPFLPGMENERP